jgi:hypothetical protein
MLNGIYERDNGKLQVMLKVNGKSQYIGTYETELKASRALVQAKKIYLSNGSAFYEDNLKDSSGQYIPLEEIQERIDLGWIDGSR